MKTAIVIANNLLRQDSPASSIEMELLEELSSKGIKIIAFCSSLGSLNTPSQSYNTIIIKESKIWKYIFAAIRFVLPDLLYLPDYHRWTCGKRMEKQIRKILKKEKVDYIHSFSNECSCHLTALHLHRDFNIPWIATFFDSWTDEPSRKFVTGFFKEKDKKMEERVARNSTAIVHNNQGIANLWEKRYGEEIAKKTKVIPLNVNFGKLKKGILDKANKECVTISHIGTFYEHRDASVFIEAVNLFCNQYPQLRNRIRVVFIGTVLNSDLTKIKKRNLTDIFDIKGRLPVEECNQYYLNSDIFLSTAGLEFEKITFPSKIVKYLFFGKPILGITPPETVMDLELREAGHRCYTPSDLDGIVRYLYDAVIDYQSLCGFNLDFWKKFSIDNIGSRYISLIDNLS